MATLTPVSVNNVGANVAAQNTAAGGDEFVYNGGRLLLAFTNGHTAAITVSFAPTLTNINSDAGLVAVPSRALAVTANGGVGVFEFTPSDVGPYLNANGRIPVTFTGHNAALVVRAMNV